MLLKCFKYLDGLIRFVEMPYQGYYRSLITLVEPPLRVIFLFWSGPG